MPKPGPVPTKGGIAAQFPSLSRRKRRRAVLTTAFAAVILVAIVVATTEGLTTPGVEAVKKVASVASIPTDMAYDVVAQSLLRNTMTAMDAAFVESAGYEAVTHSTLETLEPAIAWMQGRAGICACPPEGAKAQKNAAAWVCTGQMTYELGTWSASGVSFGVRVDKAGKGVTYYRDGKPTTW